MMPAPCILYKQGVSGDLQTVAQKGLGRVAELFFANNLDLIVTSIREGNHMPGSLHYIGLAFDFRKGPFRKADIEAVLSPPWQVIEEADHWHCEYDYACQP